MGPAPPPENVSPVVATAGLSVPLPLARSVGSMSVQAPLRLVRTAWALSVVVSVPFGLATVLESSLVSVSTATGLPVDLALAIASSIACCSGVRAGAGWDGTIGFTPPTGPWVGGVGAVSAASAVVALSRARLSAQPVPSAVSASRRLRMDSAGGVCAAVRGVLDMA